MKDEIAYEISKKESFAEVKELVDDWMDYYNNERYQWGLEKLSPSEYYRYVTTGVYPLPRYEG
jgi:transposase InsO family protein